MSRDRVPKAAGGARQPRHRRHTIAAARSNCRCRMCSSDVVVRAGRVDGFEFVACAHCRFTFAPEITMRDTDALYRAGFHGAADGAPSMGWADPSFLEPAFELLGRRSGLTIFDHGAGQSYVPEVLRANGNRVVAQDIVPPTRPTPDRVTGSLRSISLPVSQFDLVYSFQVFEHLPQPRSILERLLRMTRPGGLLLIHTDMETPEREEGFERWWYVLPPDHCAFYRHRTFGLFVEGTPYRLVHTAPKCIVIATPTDSYWGDCGRRDRTEGTREARMGSRD